MDDTLSVSLPSRPRFVKDSRRTHSLCDDPRVVVVEYTLRVVRKLHP